MRRVCRTIAIFALAISLPAFPVLAASQGTCQEYARSAVQTLKRVRLLPTRKNVVSKPMRDGSLTFKTIITGV